MKTQGRWLYFCWLITVLAGCSSPDRTDPGITRLAVAQQYRTVAVFLTQTAEVTLAGRSSSPSPAHQTHPGTLTPLAAPAHQLNGATPSPLSPTASPAAATQTGASGLTNGGINSGGNPDAATRAAVLIIPNQDKPENTPENTVTPNSVLSGAVPEGTRSPVLAVNRTPLPPCDLAHPGRPMDITIPDETRLHPGEPFSKTWRLVNAGTCPWELDYSMIWFSGDDLGVTRAQPLATQVLPGFWVDLTVDMLAPEAPGVYQSNWKLRSGSGELFGIGPNGESPFWVRIIVVPDDTPTVTPTENSSQAAGTGLLKVISTGKIELVLEERLDLDSGDRGASSGHDLIFQKTVDDRTYLTAENGARMALFGVQMPQYDDCREAAMTEVMASLDLLDTGAYLCYRTNLGLPGRITVNQVDLNAGRLTLEYQTWGGP